MIDERAALWYVLEGFMARIYRDFPEARAKCNGWRSGEVVVPVRIKRSNFDSHIHRRVRGVNLVVEAREVLEYVNARGLMLSNEPGDEALLVLAPIQ